MSADDSERLIELLDHQIEQIRSVGIRYSERLEWAFTTHPTWHENRDARIAALALGRSAVANVFLAKLFERSCLCSESWWEQWCSGFEGPYRQVCIGRFDLLAKNGIVSGLFHTVENSFRLFLRAVDPSACAGATAEFESVYKCLLTRLGQRHWEQFLTFWSLMRNTTHNNGIYSPRSGKNRDVEFDGATYHFRVGVPITCASWDILNTVAGKSSDMLFDVISSPAITSLPSVSDPSTVVPDPFRPTSCSDG